MAWTAGPSEHPHLDGACDCVPVWVTGAVFVVVASEDASFDWSTYPSLPPEAMRMGSFVFFGSSWNADEAANPACSISLF